MKFGLSALYFLAIIMDINVDAQNISLESWMNDLPSQLKEVPLIYLAIPGSHDSMTYSITPSSKVAPDADPILHGLYPLFRGTILRWTITQASDTWHQLRIGIRYFDLRLATMPNEENFYFTHGLYGDEISRALIQVKEFVDTHPGEVVILDFQHFYGFTVQHHERLMQYLIDLYGPRLVPRQVDLKALTLNSLSKLKKQIIVIYRNNSVYDTSELWQPQMLMSPWPEQDTVEGLLKYLESVKRLPGTGFVHQAVLTPSPSFILLRWPYSIREKCAIPVLLEVLPKLSGFDPGAPLPGDVRAPVNVVIGDFVDMAYALFPRTIIDLNMKLLKNTNFVGVPTITNTSYIGVS